MIFCCPAGRRHPINLIMLLIFTLSESYSISYLCSYVSYYNNSSQVVVVAAVMTFGTDQLMQRWCWDSPYTPFSRAQISQ